MAKFNVYCQVSAKCLEKVEAESKEEAEEAASDLLRCRMIDCFHASDAKVDVIGSEKESNLTEDQQSQLKKLMSELERCMFEDAQITVCPSFQKTWNWKQIVDRMKGERKEAELKFMSFVDSLVGSKTNSMQPKAMLDMEFTKRIRSKITGNILTRSELTGDVFIRNDNGPHDPETGDGWTLVHINVGDYICANERQTQAWLEANPTMWEPISDSSHQIYPKPSAGCVFDLVRQIVGAITSSTKEALWSLKPGHEPVISENVRGIAFVTDSAILIPIIRSMKPGSGFVSQFLDSLPSDARIVFMIVTNPKLRTMLLNRGYTEQTEWSELFDDEVPVMVKEVSWGKINPSH